MLKLFLTLLITTNIFALSPFSLEGIKSVNLKVIDKSKLIPEQNLDSIKNQIEIELKNANLKTTSDIFSNFIIKIQGTKLNEKYAFHISMFIVEESIPIRNQKQEIMSMTYYKDDFFDTSSKNLVQDTKESIIDYLLSDFVEQYKEEN